MLHQHKEIVINNTKIVPGQQANIRLNVARLPSGTDIHLEVHVFRSQKPGPVILVMGGMHGDEVNGVEIVRRTLTNRLFEQLEIGTAIVIPLLNIYGFINFSRDVPDGKDVNRSFPGNSSGSLASRVAYVFSKEILPLVDFGIDFHTGGGSRYNYPQIRYSVQDEVAAELAIAFAPPYLIPNKPIEKSLRHHAYKKGVPLLIYEGGESLRFDGFSIREGLDGLKRVLHYKGMLLEAPPARNSLILRKSTWIRAPRSGLFLWSIHSGQKVMAGDKLGEVHDPNGDEMVPVLSDREGYIYGHNNAPVVNQGDALFHIGNDVTAVERETL